MKSRLIVVGLTACLGASCKGLPPTEGGADASSQAARHDAGQEAAANPPTRPVSVPASAVESADSPPEARADVQDLQRMVRSNAAVLGHCYQDQVKKTPTLAGKVVVRFTVETDGSVSRVQIDDNTTHDANLGRCLQKKFEGLTFPKRETATEVSLPFIFSAAD